jgi:lipopolysaccharide export system ATP-binding protein
MPLLDVRGLEKTYGHRKVVAGVDFHVGEGEIVGLLGPNGAGKTTCFRMTCGMIEPDKGQIWLNGDDVTNWPMYKRARDGGMGYLAQESSVFRKLSVEQNLLGMMELLGLGPTDRRRRCEELLDQFQIEHLRKSKAAKLSGGERRRLEIARCLVSEPDIILLDEPFAGIDPLQVQSIQALVRGLRERSISILITDHAARELLQIADRSYVISGGVVLFHGTPDEVVRNERVRQIYLGEAIAAPPAAPAAATAPAPSPSHVSPPAPHRPPAGKPAGEKKPERPATVPISRRMTQS